MKEPRKITHVTLSHKGATAYKALKNGECDYSSGSFYSMKMLNEQLKAIGSDSIIISFSTIDSYREKDLKLFTRRLSKLDGYQATGFKNKVIQGDVFPNHFYAFIKKT